MSYGEAGSYPCTTLTTVSVTNCIQGTNQTTAGFQILPVEIEIRFFPGEITFAISAGRIFRSCQYKWQFRFLPGEIPVRMIIEIESNFD